MTADALRSGIQTLGNRVGWGAVRIGSRVLPHDNRRTSCPPGKLEPGDGPLVVVASLRRSGTHLLIDTILNNFSTYRRRPLLVNLDDLVDDNEQLRVLAECGGYVVKTHYPSDGLATPARSERVRSIAAQAVVVTPERSMSELIRARTRAREHSALPVEPKGQIQAAADAFSTFWRDFDPLVVPFTQLTDPSALHDVVGRLADAIGRTPRRDPVASPSRDHRVRVYAMKASTRLLGRRSPVINTTIAFALPQAPSRPSEAASDRRSQIRTQVTDIAGGDTAEPLTIAKRLGILDSHLPPGGRVVLDAGSGRGGYVQAIRRDLGLAAIGVEFQADKIAWSPVQAVRGAVVQGDLHDLPISDCAVDCVLLNEVLEHVPSDERALREIHRVLASDGVLVLMSPNRFYPFESHGIYLRRSGKRLPVYTPFVPYIPLRVGRMFFRYWARNYWPSELRRLVRRAGFVVTHTGYVWQTFEGIAGKQPALIRLAAPMLRATAAVLENMPFVRCLGVSQLVVATPRQSQASGPAHSSPDP